MGWFLLGNLAMETCKVTNIQYTAPASEREKKIGLFETWLSFSQMCPRWGPFVSLTIDQLYWSEWFELEQEIKVSSLERILKKYLALLSIGWAVSRHLVKSWSSAFSAGKFATVFTSYRSAIRQLAIVKQQNDVCALKTCLKLYAFPILWKISWIGVVDDDIAW